MLALSGLCMIKPARQIDWYRFRPDAWVLNDLQSTTAALQQKAQSELLRRDRKGKLSRKHRDIFVKLCLAEQARTPLRASAQRLINHLAWLVTQDALSDAQRQQFLRQIFRIELTVRPRVAPGDEVPFQFNSHFRAPSIKGRFYCEFSGAQLYIQDQLVSPGTYAPFSGRSSAAGIGIGSRFKFDKPGVHTVVARGKARFYFDYPNIEPSHETEITAEAEFELLSEEPEDYFTSLSSSDPIMSQKLKRCITPKDIRFANNQAGGPFQGTIEIDNPPFNVAFEVFARIGGKEYKVGQVSTAKGKTAICGFRAPDDMPCAESCDIILRSSEEVARHSLDMFDIWQGELVFQDLPIQLLETQPSH